MRKIKAIFTAAAVLCMCVMPACGHDIESMDMGSQTMATVGPDSQEAKPSDAPSGEDGSKDGDKTDASDDQDLSYDVHFVCAGDNLIHDTIYDQARERAGGNGYDFSFVYERVKKYIQPADISVLNQETIVTDEFEPSTYPCFCTPGALGDYMVEEVGFNVISMANNHILDKGENGLIATLDYWDNEHPDVVRYGAYRNTDDMNNIRTKEVNGIKFAFLGYMEHTNGIVHKGELGTELVYLDEIDTIEAQIKKADEIADVVVVSPHFGIEISNEVTDSQRYLSEKFIEWGADIIIGTQPHTIQECGWVESSNGNKGFVYYCLGNFVSAMGNNLSMIGGIGDLHVKMDPETHEITIYDPKIIPIITHFGYDYSDVTIYPFAEYNEDLAYSHGCEIFNMDMIREVLSNVPEEFLSIE